MKVNKTQAVLFMYELLITTGGFSKEEVIRKLEITDLTFLRYIQELRAFLFNFVNGKELVFSKGPNKYFLVNIKF